jgi:hypothetical protein
MNTGAEKARPAGREPARELTVGLKFATVPVSPDGLPSIACVSCGAPLDVHQPDADMPDRMLATCEACKGWHLLDCTAGAREVVLVLLPDPRAFRKAAGR